MCIVFECVGMYYYTNVFDVCEKVIVFEDWLLFVQSCLSRHSPLIKYQLLPASKNTPHDAHYSHTTLQYLCIPVCILNQTQNETNFENAGHCSVFTIFYPRRTIIRFLHNVNVGCHSTINTANEQKQNITKRSWISIFLFIHHPNNSTCSKDALARFFDEINM